MKQPIVIIISCEHAVSEVPKEYTALFLPFKSLLTSHRGIDFGALEIAEHLKEVLSCALYQARTTRLLIDCNRSLYHPSCFSEVTNALSPFEKQSIINQYYLPYRELIETSIKEYIDLGVQVWHLSIHSFTPIMNGVERDADIGFLYDPRRPIEKKLAQQWRKEIKKHSAYRIKMNYPYKGISDGFTSALRKKYPPGFYVGLEVESNQAITQNGTSINLLKNILSSSLLKVTFDF